MGLSKRWDVADIQRQIGACSAEVNSPYNDGFTGWSCKQDLLVLKYQLDELLRTMPEFVGEQEFIRELEKKAVWQRLGKHE